LRAEADAARPKQKWHDADRIDRPTLAAAYAFELVTNHPYRDGNKRIGFLAMVTFLGINHHVFEAEDSDVVMTFVALADGRVSEKALADWIRRCSSRAHVLGLGLAARQTWARQ
jgi:death-on-curing protein